MCLVGARAPAGWRDPPGLPGLAYGATMEANDDRAAPAPSGSQRAPSGATLVLAIHALTGRDAQALERVVEDHGTERLGWP